MIPLKMEVLRKHSRTEKNIKNGFSLSNEIVVISVVLRLAEHSPDVLQTTTEKLS